MLVGRPDRPDQNSVAVSGLGPPVCTENLNPDVVVMKSAKDRV